MPKYLNRFQSPEYLEETIIDEEGATVGTIRIKPSSVLWKPKNAREFYVVTLDAFARWITSTASGARKAMR